MLNKYDFFILHLVVKISPKVKRIADSLVGDIKKWKELQAVYLFGSQAKGRPTPLSDIDIAVMVKPSKNLKEIEADIGSSSSPTVDVVPFHRLPLYIQFEVFKYGKAIYVRYKAALLDLKIRVLPEYLDNSYLYERLKQRAR